MAAVAADRDLLFGLLALQNGLIDQGQLVAAFQAWTLDKARSPGRPPRRPRRPRCRRPSRRRGPGRACTSRSTAATSSRAWPRSPPAARPARAWPGSAIPRSRPPSPILGPASTRADGDADRTASYAVGAATSDGQRFRVLRPHARGGLGAVFVALDAELHREVALKQILDQHADDPVSRQRFLLEAEITGGLEHPGIVPVYGLGTYGDGRPYYAMRFIRGDSLKEAIDRFHADDGAEERPRPAVAGAAQAACAGSPTSATRSTTRIRRGVLHRDIKPGNIIVGKHGETLVVDWGLAKAAGPGRRRRAASTSGRSCPRSASGSAETLPGSAPGHAGLHEPGAGRRRARPAGPAVGRLQPGGHALLPADGQAAVRGRRCRRGAPQGPAGRVPAAAAARPGDRPRPWRRSA